MDTCAWCQSPLAGSRRRAYRDGVGVFLHPTCYRHLFLFAEAGILVDHPGFPYEMEPIEWSTHPRASASK